MSLEIALMIVGFLIVIVGIVSGITKVNISFRLEIPKNLKKM